MLLMGKQEKEVGQDEGDDDHEQNPDALPADVDGEIGAKRIFFYAPL